MRGVFLGHTDYVDSTDFWSQEWLLFVPFVPFVFVLNHRVSLIINYQLSIIN